MLKKRARKIITLVIAALGTSLICILPLRADDPQVDTSQSQQYYLAYIMTYSNQILGAVNNMPKYMDQLAKALAAFLNPDDSNTTADFQAKFSSLMNTTKNETAAQVTLLQQLQRDYIGQETRSTMPYANDMTYSTLLGKPYFDQDERKDTNAAYNYIKNISGINIKHTTPNPSWKGSEKNKSKYLNYFTTVSSIQMLNSYLLSPLYTDYTDCSQQDTSSCVSNPLSTQQQELMNKASDSGWFSQVASENLGIVFRQLLMFNSQMYVLLVQLLQTQKQQLTAQAMTNTLLILSNQPAESALIDNATSP